jgi:chorismate--pyruvate lyase
MNADKPDFLWRCRPVGADARTRRWLLDRGSLTQRIQRRSAQFRVELISLTLAGPNRDESALIDVGGRRACVIRDVTLSSDGTVVVFAHSIAARRALRGPWRLLLTLGTRPLGAALFADPRVARQSLRFRQVRRGHELFDAACRRLDVAAAALWARRSVFVFRGSRLLVTEVFLPAILALKP